MSKVQTGINKYFGLACSVIGTACEVAAIVTAVNATPLALQDINDQQPETWQEKAKLYGKHYWKSAAFEVGSIACRWAAYGQSESRINGLTDTILALSQAETLFKSTTKELVTPQKFDEIKGKVAQSTADKILENNKTLVVATGYGDSFFVDAKSGQKFTSNIETIRQIRNNINEKLHNGEDVYLNEYYIDMGLNKVQDGWDLMWPSSSMGDRFEKVELDIDPALDENGTPVGVISFTAPTPAYRKYK